MNPFRSPEKTLGAIDATAAASVIAAASDIALVVDGKGIIRDLAYGSDALSERQRDAWAGRPWTETVTIESRPKVERLLREVSDHAPTKPRELNHIIPGETDLPVLYSTIQLGKGGPIIAIGRDMRVVAKLQQRLVDAQRSMEREYLRLRSAESRYRLLFQLSGEAIIIIDAATLKIVDLNPAASALLEATPGTVVGRPLAELFQDGARATAVGLLDAVRGAGRVEAVRAVLANRRECFVSASIFRQDQTSHILLRFAPIASEGSETGLSPVKSRVLQVMDALPDAFVVTDPDRVVLDANRSFLEITETASAGQVRGQSLERWLGRSSVDANVLFSNLREHGSMRDFATVMRGEFGSLEEVEISGVCVPSGEMPCFGLIIHSVRRRLIPGPAARQEASRTASQLSELVGRVPLRDLVRETTELTERLCIEASLKLTGDNRAAAAQMLGLSRQSLYSKLRRYDLGDLDIDDQDN